MSIVLKAKTEKKLRKKIGWPPKKGIFEFWNKNRKKLCSYLSFVLALNTIDAQMLFWSVFWNHTKKPLQNFGIGLLKSYLTFGYLTCSFWSKKISTLHPSLNLWLLKNKSNVTEKNVKWKIGLEGKLIKDTRYQSRIRIRIGRPYLYCKSCKVVKRALKDKIFFFIAAAVLKNRFLKPYSE